MKKIEEKKTLIKYAKYLISFADQLLEKYDLCLSDVNQLKKENEVFQTRIIQSEYMSAKLKESVSNINIKPPLDEINDNFFKILFFNFIRRWEVMNYRESSKYDVEEFRENIILYKNKLVNFVQSLDQYTYYK